MVTQNVNLDLVPPRFGRSNVTVPCSQYDKDFRVINFSIFNKNVLFNIPSGSVVTIRGTKPQDNTGFEYQCTYSGNLVTFPIQEQVTVYSGEIPAELRITKDGKIIGSANFNFLVEPSPLLNETVVSETDLPLLQEALNAVDDVLAYKNEAQQSAEDSEAWAVGERNGEAVEDTDPTYHNNSKYYSEQAYASEQSASQSSADALGYKNDAKDYRDDALSYKNLAEGYKNDAYDYKELAKGYKDNAYASEVNAKASEDNAKSSEDNALSYKNDAKTYRDEAYGFKNDASGYSSDALGYKNEAKGYRDEAYGFKNEASQSKTDAKSYRDDALQYKNDASGYKDDASASATSASTNALKSEGFAVGKQNGTDVSSGSPYFENNSKYYSEQAEASYNSTLALADTYAQKDGVYPKLIAGGIIESEIKDEEFTYQQTEHTGIANLNSIKGNTLVWNQLCPIPSASASTTVNDVTITDNRDGSFTLNGTASANGNFVIASNVPTPIGHKFLIKGYVKVGSNTGFMGLAGLNIDSGSGGIWTNNLTYSQLNARIEIKSGDTFNNTKMIPQYFDLTSMFGSGNEPTIAEFTSLFPLPYYAYNTGSLLSFTGTGIKTVGFNQWDEEWEVGDIDFTTGQNASASTRWRTKNYISIMPNTTYYCRAVDVGQFLSIRARYYDADKNYIGANDGNGENTNTNYTFKTPQNAHYMRFTPNNSDIPKGTKICINISSSKNGTYEPYTTSTLSLPISTYFPTGMKSVPNDGGGTIYDELTPTRAITRIGAINLGVRDWTKNNSRFNTVNAISDIFKIASPSVKCRCALYTSDTGASSRSVDKSICIANNGFVYIYDTSFTGDADAFKTAMSDVYLFYELATESSVDVDLDLTYRTYEGGTEQLLPINTDEPTTSPLKVNVEFDFDENLNARIDKMLNCLAQVETSPTTHAYSSGDYLMYNYQLYKVTSSIAVGGTLTVGTNISATTVMSELISLTA